MGGVVTRGGRRGVRRGAGLNGDEPSPRRAARAAHTLRSACAPRKRKRRCCLLAAQCHVAPVVDRRARTAQRARAHSELGDATRRSKTPHVPRVTQDDDLQQNLLVVLACHFMVGAVQVLRRARLEIFK